MYKIAICDDENILISDLKALLTRYAEETGREFCFFEFNDGLHLLNHYQPDFDLIFMDIKMETMDGLETAEEIRRNDSTVGIVFLTSLAQYVWKGYEYGAVNYLLKPLKYGRLKMELDRFFERYKGREEPFLAFANDSGKYKVLYKNLRFAETHKRNVLLHFDDQQQVIYKNMKELSALLEAQPQFCRCHASYVVNLSFVKSIEGAGDPFNNGRACPDQSAKTQRIYGEVG